MEINLSPRRRPRVGHHVFLSIFQSITGMSWLSIFSLFPRHNLYADHPLNVYHVQKFGFGWEAAFFACLIPTTVGIMGPAFLVPVALGLFFLPLCIFVTFNYQTLWSYLVVFIICYFLDGNACTLGYFSGYRPRPIIILSLKGNLNTVLW